MTPPRPTEPSLSPAAALRIDGLCDRFEAEWAAGGRPRIEDLVVGLDPADRSAAFRELLRLELALRRLVGEAPSPDEYRLRFRDVSTEVDAVFALDEWGRTEVDGTPASTSPAPLPTAPDGPSPDPRALPTSAPAGYEILEVLGRGGMGVVYRAHQVRLKRDVALKMVLAGEHASPEAVARFQAEAEAIARLRHPNVVQIFDLGDHQDRPFFAMEFLPRGSLARELDGTPRPPWEAAALVERIARGVAEAHRLGIVHRDLKPANILIADDGTPKVADFGLAKSLDTDSGLTRPDLIVGTPSYMAPEQASGSTGGVGPEADVHALGALLYELLTGRPPFRGASALETMLQVRSIDPVPPRRLVPGIPRDLETIVLTCLQKDPGRRFKSAGPLADDLCRYLEGRPVVARPAGVLRRAWKWSRRRPGAATALAATVLALAAILGVSWAYNLRLARALGRANRAEREAEANARDAGRQRNLALNALKNLVYGVQDQLGADPASRELRQSLLDLAIVDLRELAQAAVDGASDLSRADAHQRLGDLFLQVGRTPEALEQYRLSTALAERLLAARPDDPAVLATLSAGYTRIGDRLTNDNRPGEAIPLLHRAVARAARRARIAPSDAATHDSLDALRMLARAYLWQRRADEARSTVAEMTTLAREWAERSPDDADALVEWSDAITLSASVAELAGEPPGLLLDQAVAILRRARKLDPTSRSSRDSLQVALADLGALAFAEGRFDDAARLYEEGLGLLDETALEDPEHLDTQLKIIDTQANLAACLRNRGRFAESASRLRPAVERLRALKGAGRLRGLAVYENERLPLMEADLALAEAAPRALADREYARTRPAPLAARLLAFRLRDAAGRGDDVGVAAEAEALLGLDAVEASELVSLARARAACYPLLAPGLRERCAAGLIDALGRALELEDEAAAPLLGEPIFDGVRELLEFRALADRFLGSGRKPR